MMRLPPSGAPQQPPLNQAFNQAFGGFAGAFPGSSRPTGGSLFQPGVPMKGQPGYVPPPSVDPRLYELQRGGGMPPQAQGLPQGVPFQGMPFPGQGMPFSGMPPQVGMLPPGMPPQMPPGLQRPGMPIPFEGGMPGYGPKMPKPTFNPQPFEGMGGLGGAGKANRNMGMGLGNMRPTRNPSQLY